MWALAFVQLGVRIVGCVPLTPLAVKNLEALMQCPRWKQALQVLKESELSSSAPRVIAGNIDCSDALSLIVDHFKRHSQEWFSMLLVGLSSTVTMRRQVKSDLGDTWYWQTIRHRSIGGLTAARKELGFSSIIRPSAPFTLDTKLYPKRPQWRFLEPSVKLDRRDIRRSEEQCWRPVSFESSFPWPWGSERIWVEAPTCFKHKGVRGGLVERPLTVKEQMQLMDLNEEWGARTLQLAWSWENGGPTPMRILTEFIRLVDGIRHRAQIETELDRKKEIRQTKDIPASLRISVDEIGDLSDGGALRRMEYFGWVWDDYDGNVQGAARADGAAVDFQLWAVGGDGPGMEISREILRKFLLNKWKRRLRAEAAKWLKTEEAQEDYALNLEAVRDCVRRFCAASWWDWADGSRLLFWRWPVMWRREARDGAMGFHAKYPPSDLQSKSCKITDPRIAELDAEKLEKLLRRRYIVPGRVQNLVPRFAVPKGDDDIRVVWDLARSGLNECMFTPSFYLPTMGTFLRSLVAGTFCGDFDIGEQFHNYILHRREQVYCGVSVPANLVQQLRAEGLEVEETMRWERLVFGWQSSPYLALRMLARAIELSRGAPWHKDSVFAWDKIILNLPGAPNYDPGAPRVSKLGVDGLIAPDLIIYFDDGRVTGPTEEITRIGTRQITSRLQFLGNQDAARKRGKISLRPNAWAGGVAFTDHGVCRKTISQEKWDKVKRFLEWVETSILDKTSLNRKMFVSGKGFLLHVAQTFDVAQPYLKGFHLAENLWRPGRDTEGWKVQTPEREIVSDCESDSSSISSMESCNLITDWEEWDLSLQDDVNNPEDDSDLKTGEIKIFPPRLLDDVQALRKFFASESPTQVLVRPVAGACFVAYGAGDASGEGFGSRIYPLGLQPLLRRGFWCTEESEHSSNWREMRNLLDALREEVERGRLVGRELWLATDNSTAANAYFKGSSNSRLLHEMITELRCLTLKGNFILHIFHIAGTRMIQIGIDALSRGELHAAALAQTPESAAPLHLTPTERSSSLEAWFRSWLGEGAKITSPADWYFSAQQGGQHDSFRIQSETWIWNLPPAAAINALEELGSGRLKRHETLRGIVIIPNLLQNEWFRRFTRVVDCYITIPAGAIPEWPESMHEGLTIGFYFPLLRCQPWCWRRIPFLVQLCVKLSKMYRASDPSAGDLLRKFWAASLRLADVQKGVLKGKVPEKDSHRDMLLMKYIRRANLDAFWSRRPGTINGLVNLFEEQVDTGDFFGFEMFEPLGPFPISYDSGIKAAIGILRRSQRPGRHEATLKFSAARKARSVFTNLYLASARAAANILVFRSDRNRMVASTAPTDSVWFHYFMSGFRARVGERTKQDAAISIQVMMEIQSLLEADLAELQEPGQEILKRDVIEHGAFFLFLYCGSLRGFEGPKVELSSLKTQLVAPGSLRAQTHQPHVILTLTGRFKARSQAQQSIQIPLAYTTASGLEPGKWAERLIDVLRADNVETGWAFQSPNGDQLSMSHFDEKFYELLARIKGRSPHLFSPEAEVYEDFHIARSFRRGATTRATNAGVPASDIDWMNRWNVGAEHGSTNMRVLYSDRLQMLETYLRFSSLL